jgi:hypothetical protein
MARQMKSLGCPYPAGYVLIVFLALAPSILAQSPVLEVRVADTTALEGQTDAVIPIYMRNYQDTIAAFEVTLTSDHPDVLEFQLDSLATEGTLVSSWQFLSIAEVAADTVEIKAIANTINPPYTPGIGYPQFGDIPLVKVLANVGAVPDTTQTPSIAISIIRDYHDFCFSDERGNTIGLRYDTVYDTTYYVCTEWEPGPEEDSTCVNWEEVAGPPADSVAIYISYKNHYIDSTLVYIFDGSLTLLECCQLPGDADRSGNLNLLDATYIISYLYKNGPAPVCYPEADFNCDCTINILDARCLIIYIYQIGEPCTRCTCEEWQAACGGK